MADKTVGVSNQSQATGVANIDTSELTNSQGVTVERQRAALGDFAIPGFLASVDSSHNLAVSEETASAILDELRAIRHGIGILINVDLKMFLGIDE